MESLVACRHALYRGVGRDDLIKHFYEGYNYRITFLRPWDIFITPSAEEDTYIAIAVRESNL